MLFHRTSISIFFIAAILNLTSACSASAQMSCSALKYGTPRYHENMDKLAKRAGLPDNTWTRYDEDVVTALCSGNNKSVNRLIDDGSVKPAEAQAIAKVLGKTFQPHQQSQAGKGYAQAKAKFLEMGACSACADNIAQYYTKRPASTCGKLAAAALAGDANSIREVTSFPDYCTWKYELFYEPDKDVSFMKNQTNSTPPAGSIDSRGPTQPSGTGVSVTAGAAISRSTPTSKFSC